MSAEKLAALRAQLAQSGVHGFIVPVADEYLGEYVPACAQRLAWLTNFTGSAGAAAILPDKAALFVDGRYTLQARNEVDAAAYEHFNSGEIRLDAWLAEHAPLQGVIGYDPMLHSISAVEGWKKTFSAKGLTLKPLIPNPLNLLWQDRPATPSEPAFVHALRYAGIPHAEKRAAAADILRKRNAHATVLVASDSINWLLNIRGHDLVFTPVVLAYAILHDTGKVELFADPAKFSPELRAHFGEDIAISSPDTLPDALAELGAAHARILLDPILTPAWFADALTHAGAEIMRGEDPCQAPKAIKNAAELEGTRQAHRRDGLAVTRFLCWLDAECLQRTVTEMEASIRLLEYRRAHEAFFSPSFETIAGSGPNGAIVHYRVTEASNRALKRGELFLLDSGGQYPDGTTDITRTVAIGKPSAEQCERFTRVLKGHIALARTRFPEGTGGTQLDIMARHDLWQAGLDYEHGTGHGVGSFLGVHEGPQRVGKRGGEVGLKAGMILSNEPGYYKEGAYGIRIESLLAVIPRGKMESGTARLGFETLTCVPIDRTLIVAKLLTLAERDWLNAYHAWVYETHAPMLTPAQKRWLKKVCRKI